MSPATVRFVRRVAAFAVLAATLLLPGPWAPQQAEARRGASGPDTTVVDWAVGDTATNITPLQNLLLSGAGHDTRPLTIVFGKGTHELPTRLLIFNRGNVTLCGATGKASDTVLTLADTSGSRDIFLLLQATDITFRDLTIRTTRPGGACLSLAGIQNTGLGVADSFVDGVTVDDCVLEADQPIIATAGVDNLTVQKSSIEVTLTDASGILWGDGEGLFVAKNSFTTGRNATTGDRAQALAAVQVFGAAAAFADGERARGIFITRNRVKGDFGFGFRLLDPLEVRVRRNKIEFSGDPVRPATPGSSNVSLLRTGIDIERSGASNVPEDFEIRRNRVRGAGYGANIQNAGRGVVARNNFKRCGSTIKDEFFGEFGGGLRAIFFSPVCRLEIARNDFRALRTPRTDGADDVAAVTTGPPGFERVCADALDARNKLSKGRLLFVGGDQ